MKLVLSLLRLAYKLLPDHSDLAISIGYGVEIRILERQSDGTYVSLYRLSKDARASDKTLIDLTKDLKSHL